MAHDSLYVNKLQRHARKFYQCHSPGKVLQRYASECLTMKGAEFSRHISHVCAWIVLAIPLARAAELCSISESSFSSPVRLLVHLLCTQKHKKWDDRSWLALDAVRSACKVVLTTEADRYDRRNDWIDLENQLPKRRRTSPGFTKVGAEDPEADDDVLNRDVDATGVLIFKRARRLNREIVKWKNRNLIESEARIGEIEHELQNMVKVDVASIDTVALRRLLYVVTGALSSPRKQSTMERKSTLTAVPPSKSFYLQHVVSFQKRVRKSLICGIRLWRDHLNLEDPQIQPILETIRGQILQFESLHDSLENACDRKTWQKLSSAASAEPLAPAAGLGAPHSEHRKRGDSIAGGFYTPLQKIQSLSTVEYRPNNAKVLECGVCRHQITSSWFFVHPVRKDARVIRPLQGHFSPCRAKYVSIDGSPSQIDNFFNLYFCHHTILFKDCKKCNPRLW